MVGGGFLDGTGSWLVGVWDHEPAAFFGFCRFRKASSNFRVSTIFGAAATGAVAADVDWDLLAGETALGLPPKEPCVDPDAGGVEY
jgi:hypothetical protein